MYVIRWNHSGDPAKNPEQHNPVELTSVPQLDAQTGGLRPGVAEDFPNGGGNRAYVFVLEVPQGRLSWFFHDSASAIDLHLPIVVAGKNCGAPLDNLKRAMSEAKIDGLGRAVRLSPSSCYRFSDRKRTSRCIRMASGIRFSRE